MKFDYDKTNKKIVLDFDGTLILNKNDVGLEMTREFIENEDNIIEIKNAVILGEKNRGKYNSLIGKVKQSIKVLKYVWLT